MLGITLNDVGDQTRAFVEFHHVKPWAVGGEATAANIELRCRSHNHHEARVFFDQGFEHFVDYSWPRSNQVIDDVSEWLRALDSEDFVGVTGSWVSTAAEGRVGDSEVVIHVGPALAHGALIVLAAAFTYRLGGGTLPQLLAGLDVAYAEVQARVGRELDRVEQAVGHEQLVHPAEKGLPPTLEEAGELGETEEVSTSLNNIGIALYQLGDYEQALTYYRQSLKYYEAEADTAMITSSLNNIGLSYFEQEQYDRSLSTYARALAMYQRALHHSPGLGQRCGQGFVADDVDAALEEFARHRIVHVVRRHHRHEVDALSLGEFALSLDHLLPSAIGPVISDVQVLGRGLGFGRRG